VAHIVEAVVPSAAMCNGTPRDYEVHLSGELLAEQQANSWARGAKRALPAAEVSDSPNAGFERPDP
jgi:hypothetical protein